MIKDRQELVERIREAAQGHDSFLVAIDGADGSGKTTLSTFLQSSLDCRIVNLDDLVEKEKGAFLQFLDRDGLRQAIEEATAVGRCVIIEGVCVAQVLGEVGIVPNLRVYVKKLRSDDYWCDQEKIYGGASTVEEKLALEEQRSRDFADLDGEPMRDEEPAITGLKRDIIGYHWRFCPDKNADIVFGNVMNDA